MRAGIVFRYSRWPPLKVFNPENKQEQVFTGGVFRHLYRLRSFFLFAPAVNQNSRSYVFTKKCSFPKKISMQTAPDKNENSTDKTNPDARPEHEIKQQQSDPNITELKGFFDSREDLEPKGTDNDFGKNKQD